MKIQLLLYLDLGYIINSLSGMLKNLKKGKQDKKQAKKQTNKQKTSKNDNKKPKEQEEEQTNTELVDINYNQKQTTVKTVKKVQASKLEEKQIDTSNIVIEKKQEKKVITSWIVNEAQIKNLLRKDFNAAEHETEFVSLTDDTINKQLEEQAKKNALDKPKIVEMGGIKMAPLQNTEKGKEQDFVFSKRQETTGIITNLPVKDIVFVNSNQGGSLNFAPLQKTPQQLKQEELEARAKKEPELVVKSKANGWLGVKANEPKPPQAEFKVSAWALKAEQSTNQPISNFAPLQKTAQEMKLLEGGSRRQEQQFKFTSKKQVEERRKKRQMQEAALKEASLKKL